MKEGTMRQERGRNKDTANLKYYKNMFYNAYNMPI